MNNISFTIQWWHVALVASGISSFIFRNKINNMRTFLSNKLKARASPCPDGRIHSCSMCKDTGIIRGKNGIGRECSCKIVNYWNKELTNTHEVWPRRINSNDTTRAINLEMCE